MPPQPRPELSGMMRIIDPETGHDRALLSLPPFGSTTACLKCGVEFATSPVSVRWSPHGESAVLDSETVVDDEAMVKSCRVCGWTFAEAPKEKGR